MDYKPFSPEEAMTPVDPEAKYKTWLLESMQKVRFLRQEDKQFIQTLDVLERFIKERGVGAFLAFDRQMGDLAEQVRRHPDLQAWSMTEGIYRNMECRAFATMALDSVKKEERMSRRHFLEKASTKLTAAAMAAFVAGVGVSIVESENIRNKRQQQQVNLGAKPCPTYGPKIVALSGAFGVAGVALRQIEKEKRDQLRSDLVLELCELYQPVVSEIVKEARYRTPY